jgi:hypothetical protein
MGFTPMRFLTDDTNSISDCKIPTSVRADPRVCSFPGRTRRCAPYQTHVTSLSANRYESPVVPKSFVAIINKDRS